MIGSYFLIPDVTHRVTLSRKYLWAEILHFGKWIFLTSIIYFLSINFDRLYLASVIPLALLGVYGIARTISELLSSLVLRLGAAVIFPFISSHSHVSRDDLHKQMAPIRLAFLFTAAVVFAFAASTVDLAIKVVFDQRYHAAGWMVPILIVGAWISILCSVDGVSTLLGLGKPVYAAVSNGLKLGWLSVALPVSFASYGALGSIIVVSVSDIWRYVPLLIGQIRQKFSFASQDLWATIFVVVLIVLFEIARWFLGLGTSFEDLPIGDISSAT